MAKLSRFGLGAKDISQLILGLQELQYDTLSISYKLALYQRCDDNNKKFRDSNLRLEESLMTNSDFYRL